MLAKDLVAQRLKYCEEIDAAACFDRVFYDARGKQFPNDRAAGFSDAIYGARHTPNSGRKVIPLAHAVRSQTSQQPTTHDCLIVTDESSADGAAVSADHRLKIALHAHLFYPEVIPDFVRLLQKTRI